MTAVRTHRAVLHRQYLGAYCSAWKPWQQNNIRRNWSDEPVMLEKEMNGGVNAEQIKNRLKGRLIHADQNFLYKSGFFDLKKASIIHLSLLIF